MEPLFIEEPKFEKVARVVLDQDATKWTKQILDEFFTEFPYFMSQNVDIQYKKKDKNKGYAVGTITIENLTVPIIITNYELASFDVVYKDGITLPLTEETLGAIASSPSAFQSVVPVDKSKGEVDMLFTRPLVDLQPAPSIGKTASVIDRISDTITVQHKKDLLEKLSSKEIRAGFEKNNTVSVLAKIANVIPKPDNYFTDSLSKVLPRDIHYLEKISRFKYRLYEGNSQVYDPIISEIDDKVANEYEEYKVVGEEIEKKAEFNHTKGAAFKIDGLDENLIVLNVDGMRKYAYANIPVSDDSWCNNIFSGEMPQLNDYGVWTNGNVATKPFEIVGMIKSAGLYEIDAFDGTSGKTYIPLRSVDEITPHEDRDNTYYIPTSYKFVKVGESTEIEPTHDISKGIANYYMKDDVGLYNLQGPVFKKYAEFGNDTTAMQKGDAIWAAIQCGANETDIKKLANAPSNVRVPFESVLNSPKPLQKVAEYLKHEYEDYSKKISAIAKDLVKEAATLADPTSVDAVLALNMVTKENILEFVHQLPLYEQVVSDLAKLLITVRLGLSTIPEFAVQRSMKELSKVIEILRGMSKLERVK